MLPRTVFLSRLLGLFYILAAISMFLHKQTYVETVAALLQNPSVMFVVGIVTLLAGLAMVLAHNIWSRGAVAVLVTLIGWLALIKGLLFLFLPPQAEAEVFLRVFHYGQLYYMYAAISLVLGVYLTYRGFTSSSDF
jgi:putative exporter of polyketide antibiotics